MVYLFSSTLPFKRKCSSCRQSFGRSELCRWRILYISALKTGKMETGQVGRNL